MAMVILSASVEIFSVSNMQKKNFLSMPRKPVPKHFGLTCLQNFNIYPILDTRISVCLFVRSFICHPMSSSGDPPWIMKRAGLESSGPPNIGKLSDYHFFLLAKIYFTKKVNC